MKKYLAIILIVTSIASCNNPLNKKFSTQTFEQDAKAIGESKKLNDEDAKLLAGYIMMAKIGNKDLSNLTYAEILKTAKDFRQQQIDLAEKAKKEEQEKMERLNSSLIVAVYDKKLVAENEYSNHFEFAFAFENKTSKKIRAVKGTMRVTNLFDDKIKNIGLVHDYAIEPNATSKATYNFDYNEFMDEDKTLASKEMKDLKFVWVPEKIIFEDGTTLE